MGVPGLWDVLRPTGKVRALAHLAVEDGFVANTHGHRAYRIGIDASIWFFHALGGREGENPELRTLFFRCARLLAMPYLPIFVFDGPGRPNIKRGKAVGGKEHWLVNSLRTVLEAFGFECRTAPGEAEAELAFLNRVGAIDAVLSDDVDCFIFGAHTVMRNGSVTLSGNRATAAGDAQHVYIYRAQDLVSNPAVGLSQGGLILIALLRGGDYDGTGVAGCGVGTAHALARVGFGDTLLAAARAGPAALTAFLPTWRVALREELRTNASGLAQRKCPTMAKHITDDFPSLDVLRCYTHPLTSERGAGLDLAAYGLGALWTHQADVGKIAHVCERYFEWGFEESVVKRFRTVIWPGAILRTLLRAALERDTRERDAPPTHSGGSADTPSKALARSLGGMALNRNQDSDSDDDVSDTNDDRIDAAALIKTIHSTRRHASTDNMLEYRIEVRPRALVARTRAGMQGLRVVNHDSARDPGEDDDGDEDDEKPGTRAPDPDSTLRVWMPASVVEYACPRLVAAFESRQAKKAAKKSGKGTAKGRAKAKEVKGFEAEGESDSYPVKPKARAPAKAKSKATKSKPSHDEQESDGVQSKKIAVKPTLTEARRAKENIGGLHTPKTKPTAHSLRRDDSSKSLIELFDDDPFLVSAGLSPTHPKARQMHISSELPVPRKLRPFPMSLDDDDDDGDDADPAAAPSRPVRVGRKHAASASSSDTGIAHVKKSPRKSAEHTSPRKLPAQESPPARAPSPSPMRPLQRARMKPLQTARATTSKSHEDIIVISSDSDAPLPPLKARPKALKAPPSTVRHRGGGLSPSNLNLTSDADVIDLT